MKDIKKLKLRKESQIVKGRKAWNDLAQTNKRHVGLYRQKKSCVW